MIKQTKLKYAFFILGLIFICGILYFAIGKSIVADKKQAEDNNVSVILRDSLIIDNPIILNTITEFLEYFKYDNTRGLIPVMWTSNNLRGRNVILTCVLSKNVAEYGYPVGYIKHKGIMMLIYSNLSCICRGDTQIVNIWSEYQKSRPKYTGTIYLPELLWSIEITQEDSIIVNKKPRIPKSKYKIY